MKPRNKTTDKLNALSALAGADTNTDPTPEEVKRVMSYIGRKNNKFTPEFLSARAKKAGIAAGKAHKRKKRLSTVSGKKDLLESNG